MLDYFIAEVGAHCIRDQSFFVPDITDLDLHYILIQEYKFLKSRPSFAFCWFVPGGKINYTTHQRANGQPNQCRNSIMEKVKNVNNEL